MCVNLRFPPNSLGGNQTDNDWNLAGRSNCAPPIMDSIQWLEEGGRRFARFQLRDKDFGNCPTDQDPVHSTRFNKPYSERAEWWGSIFMDNNTTTKISFDGRFVKGFDQGRASETFMQIKDCPTSKVPVMVKLGGRLQDKNGFRGRTKIIFSLCVGHPNQVKRKIWLPRYPIGLKVDNQWHRVDAFFTRGLKHTFSLFGDGLVILPETKFPNVFTCKNSKLHIGVYRSGNLAGNC